MAKKDEEEDIVIVTDDPKDLDSLPQEQDEDSPSSDIPPDKEQEEDQEGEEGKDQGKDKSKTKVKERDEDEDEDEGDSRLAKSEDQEEEDDEKARSKGKSRRQRRKEAEARLRRERDFLERRNDQLERQIQTLAQRMDRNELTTLDSRIASTKALIQKAEGVISEAINAKKGEDVVEATRIRDNLRDSLRNLETAKGRAEEGDERPAPPQALVTKARQWVTQNKWYDPNLGDIDSRIAKALDDSVLTDGFDPTSDEYWSELNKRIAERLPHRVKSKKNGRDVEEDDDDDEDDDREERRPSKKRARVRRPPGGPKFRSGGSDRQLKSNEVYLSRERIDAMKEAGVWDDPETRTKYLKRYREYDKEHGNT